MTNEASHYHVEPLFAQNRGAAVRGNGPFRDLPNAKEEIEKIEKVLKGGKVKVTPLTGSKGTEESFLSLSGKAPSILHVATHGFYYTAEKAKDVNYLKGYNDAMMLSGLIMSGGNLAWTGRKVPEGVLGGVLTANNIACLDLRGTDLLVLSACQTGLGVATPEGLFGLQRAFKKAGVQTMVMSLWSVNDEVAKDFMIKFYEELARNNWDKRKAFDDAKANVRNNPRYKKDPYYWAAFVMLD
jgi:CHAT domain-containing protein